MDAQEVLGLPDLPSLKHGPYQIHQSICLCHGFGRHQTIVHIKHGQDCANPPCKIHNAGSASDCSNSLALSSPSRRLFQARDACFSRYSARCSRNTCLCPPDKCSAPDGRRNYTSSSSSPFKQAVRTSNCRSTRFSRALPAKSKRIVWYEQTGANVSAKSSPCCCQCPSATKRAL
jgi:hypothetical protein